MLQREKERRKMKANLDKWRIIAETFLTFCSLIGVALRMSGRARVEEVDRGTGRLRHGGRGRDSVRETDRQTDRDTVGHRESSLVPSKYIIVSKLM